MIVTIIGIGLIGGSLALSLREAGLATQIIGVDQSFENQTKALSLGLIDEVADLASGISRADLIVLAVPMDAMLTLLPKVLDSVADHQIVIDVGSTKQKLLGCVEQHPRRARFVAVHPMAGTEYSGPEAAVQGLFQGKTLVICDAEHSDPAAVTRVGAFLSKSGCGWCTWAGPPTICTRLTSLISRISPLLRWRSPY
ncbi:prephenate dehydrogenase/arogenate dehydrogenase family protein [Hymenobacter qilianensis]|uniref:prephenate dehydrogenase/arogenate dehydrogenase family protein n=1 Tax=Hymenobacter qilianensis TaxID=1385715 RepID=UPI0021D05102|nr:prephenate dehydrogenase/arogenate dehydrogenase family protein [Hymenobacter qilianensis]